MFIARRVQKSRSASRPKAGHAGLPPRGATSPPARRLGGGSQALLQSAVVDLDHDAVRLELERAPLLPPLFDEGLDLCEAPAAPGMRVDAESELPEPLE